MNGLSATPIDWATVLLIITTAATIGLKWLAPAIMNLRKPGDSNGNGGGPRSQQYFELGKIESILDGRTGMFERMIDDQRRIAEEQGRIAQILGRVEKIVSEIEERGRGQDKAIDIVLRQATLQELRPATIRRGRGK